MIKGSCACGRIQYQTQAKPLCMVACHCATCQQVSGGPYLGFTAFETKDLEWTQQPDIWQKSDIATRGHCKTCGSAMTMQYFFNTDRIGICLGSVTSADPALPPLEEHIFIEEKAPYFVFADDGAKRCEGFPPEDADKIKQWRAKQQK
jgi:hypothetical protein